MEEQAPKITDENWCRQQVDEKVFKLQPRDYHLKHPKWPGMVGIEVELQPYTSESFKAGSKPEWVKLMGSGSLVEALEPLSALRDDWKFEYSEGESKLLMAVKLEEQDQLTFEPGGQIEISSKPYPCLDDASTRIMTMLAFLREHFSSKGISLWPSGLNPWYTTEDLPLQMTKPRYQAMDRYFNQIGPYGRQMMRLTSTVQVNLDFGEDTQTLAKRYLAANLLAPIATAIFANSAFSSGKVNGEKSYRSKIWRHLDASRTGFPMLTEILSRLDKSSCVDAYNERLMHANVVFIEALNYEVPVGNFSFAQWVREGYKGVFPTEKDFATHLSLFFPEVRARGFLELRSVDVQSWVWQLVPACFFTALIYDDQNLDELIHLLSPEISQLEPNWQKASKGLEDEHLAQLAKTTMQMALSGFSHLPACFQGEQSRRLLSAFAERFTFRSRTPADELLESYRNSGNEFLSADTLVSLEENWGNFLAKK